jgi:mutator protein MutT
VKGGKFLAERRRKDKEAYPGMLAVPGGRMEHGESNEDTLVREMQEELSVTPLDFGYYCSLDDPDVYGGLTIHYYWVESWIGEPIPGEADKLVWLSFGDHGLIEVPIDRDAVARLIELREIST